MVSDNLKAHVVAILVIDLTRQFLHFTNDWHEEVRFKVSLSPLDNGHQTLQTSARINILVWQFLVFTTRNSRVCVKLRQNDIPDFDITVVFDIFCKETKTDIFWVKGFSTVKENLCIWSRRSRTDFPEVVFDWDQVAWVHSYFNPAVVRIFIVWIVGHVEFFSWKIKPFRAGQKLISPSDSFITEVIPDREVPQHFKHSMVTRSLPDIFDVVGTDSFLGIGDTWIFRDNGPVKVFLKCSNP